MIKVYYVVTKQLNCADPNVGIQETTGYKTIDVYSIENGEIEKFFDLDLRNEDNAEMEIQIWLDDNGYSDKEFEFIQL